MKKNVINAQKLAQVKEAFNDACRGGSFSKEDAMKTIGGFLDSITEEDGESAEEAESRMKDEMKKVVIDSINDRLSAQATKNASNPELAKKFANNILDAVIDGKQGKVVDAMKLITNDVSGLEFPKEIEIEIRKAWTRSERILAIFNRTVRASIPYTNQEDTDNDVLAHIQANPTIEKVEQNLKIQYVNLVHRYFYKKQKLTRDQIADMRNAGTEVATIAEIYRELTQQVINGIVRSALITGAANDAGVFMHSIARKTSDTFVTVSTMASTTPTVTEVRTAADDVITDSRKIALMSSKVKTALATLAPNTTGRTFMPEEELLSELGVDEIITNNVMQNCVIILSEGDAYAIGNFGQESLRWSEYGYNAEFLMVEERTCGEMYKPRGASVILPPAITLTIAAGTPNTVTVTVGSLADGDYRMVASNSVAEKITLSSNAGTSSYLPVGTYRVISDGSVNADSSVNVSLMTE